MVPEVGLEPTKPYGGRFTVSCDCHYTIPAWNLRPRFYTLGAKAMQMEPIQGFEPRTCCLQNSCSNQLS